MSLDRAHVALWMLKVLLFSIAPHKKTVPKTSKKPQFLPFAAKPRPNAKKPTLAKTCSVPIPIAVPNCSAIGARVWEKTAKNHRKSSLFFHRPTLKNRLAALPLPNRKIGRPKGQRSRNYYFPIIIFLPHTTITGDYKHCQGMRLNCPFFPSSSSSCSSAASSRSSVQAGVFPCHPMTDF